MLHRPCLQTAGMTGSQKARQVTGKAKREAQGLTHRHQVGISAVHRCLALDRLSVRTCSSIEWLRLAEGPG